MIDSLRHPGIFPDDAVGADGRVGVYRCAGGNDRARMNVAGRGRRRKQGAGAGKCQVGVGDDYFMADKQPGVFGPQHHRTGGGGF